MTSLLDTHILIWLYNEPAKVPAWLKEQVAGSTGNLVSVISAWEYGIKRRKHGDSFGPPFAEVVRGAAFQYLDFPYACHADAETLPPIHADPFDRMLVAHARHLGCPLVTADEAIRRYPVEVLW